MAINPPSDLVLDVARAADPDAMRASAEKLRSLTSMRAADPVAGAAFTDEPALAMNVGSMEPPPQSAQAKTAYTKFEAFMLQSFVESMFSTDTSSVFGKGIAGDYWKSMMSEAIANQMADAGGIGIAKTLESDRARKAASLEVEDSQADSTAMLHQMERQLIRKQLEKQDAAQPARTI